MIFTEHGVNGVKELGKVIKRSAMLENVGWLICVHRLCVAFGGDMPGARANWFA